MSLPLLTGLGLVVERDGRRVLDGVDIELWPGERVALLGPSGSGKTTLLTLLAGLDVPSQGTVLRHPGPPGTHAGVGLVLQGYGLVSLLTAEENVALPLMARRLSPAEVDERSDDALRAVGLAHRSRHLLEEMSGGEQQRVAVARALATRPQVLLADEPTAELDAASRAIVLDLLLAAATTGVAVVIATHDPAVARRCDRRLYVRDGRLFDHAPDLSGGAGRH